MCLAPESYSAAHFTPDPPPPAPGSCFLLSTKCTSVSSCVQARTGPPRRLVFGFAVFSVPCGTAPHRTAPMRLHCPVAAMKDGQFKRRSFGVQWLEAPCHRRFNGHHPADFATRCRCVL